MKSKQKQQKKQEQENKKEKEKTIDWEGLIARCWQHYQTYLQQQQQQQKDQKEGGGSDIDDLVEIVELLEPHCSSSCGGGGGGVVGVTNDNDDKKDTNDVIRPYLLPQQQQNEAATTKITTLQECLPILLSVASTLLAEDAVGRWMTVAAAVDSNADNNDTNDTDNDQLMDILQALELELLDHLQRAVTLFPQNAQTWSIAANYARMKLSRMSVVVQSPQPFFHIQQKHVAHWYRTAAKYASHIRSVAIQILSPDDDEDNNNKHHNKRRKKNDDDNKKNNKTKKGSSAIPEDVKEWVEALLLHQIAGVHSEDDDDSDDESDNSDDTESENSDDDDDGAVWSASTVEATCRFMAAMILSCPLGQHDAALEELHYFYLTHRIHPVVWNAAAKAAIAPTETTTITTTATTTTPQPFILTAPLRFQGILPQPIYKRLCQVFAPSSAYWRETNYATRGYFSFFQDYKKDNHAKQEHNNNKSNKSNRKKQKQQEQQQHGYSNLIEHVICEYLLPPVQEQLLHEQTERVKQKEFENNNNNAAAAAATDVNTEIVGFEWWVHTRPVSANLGHNLHFDTDEAMLARGRYQRRMRFQKQIEQQMDNSDASDDFDVDFDYDDGEDDKYITHPLVSSVLYLTTGEKEESDTAVDSDTNTRDHTGAAAAAAGATIVLNQTPQATEVADCAWFNIPKRNTFLTFPGNLLHGVLPCPGAGGGAQETDDHDDNNNNDSPTAPDISLLWRSNEDDVGDVNDNNKQKGKNQTPISTTSSSGHRLTFMVGFWTRRVPDGFVAEKQPKPYGPCRPLPNPYDDDDEQHTWVREICKGYSSSNEQNEQPWWWTVEPLTATPKPPHLVPSISPAWECIPNNRTFTGNDPELELPRGIDHRFFVQNAPDCFRANVFWEDGDENHFDDSDSDDDENDSDDDDDNFSDDEARWMD